MSIFETFFKEGKVLKEKDLSLLKKAVADRLEFLQNEKERSLLDIKDQFKKYFAKSLDHKSLKYSKDFNSRYLNTKKNFHLNLIRSIAEDNLLKTNIRECKIGKLYGAVEAQEGQVFFNSFGKDFAKAGPKIEPTIPQDHPIDMRFLAVTPIEVLNQNKSKFPQARFEFSNKMMIRLTIKLCICYLDTYGDQELKLTADMMKFMLKFIGIHDFDQI